MFFRSPARAGTLLSAFAGVLLAVVTSTAHARAPVFTGNPILADFEGTLLRINLREQNVITGGPSITITVGNIIVDGQPGTLVGVSPFVLQAPTTVCLTIEDEGFDPLVNTSAAVQLTATNGRNESSTAIVPILLQPGPVVDPPEFPACEDPNAQPTAVSGGDRTINDTDGQPEESVVLDGSASSDPDPGTELIYTWGDVDNDVSLGSSTSPTLTVSLDPGVHNLQLTVQDESNGQNSLDFERFVVTVNGPVAPIANAGQDRTVDDTDGQPGETVTLDASGSSDADGTIVEYDWSVQIDADTLLNLGTGQTITARLPDDGGFNVLLRVTDNAGNVGRDSVLINVTAPGLLPTANAGPDRNVADTDGQPGESVTLDGSASTDPSGAIAAYQWLRQPGGDQSPEVLGTGQTLTVTLPDGVNDIVLIVTNAAGSTATDFLVITVAQAPPETILSAIAGLTPNQRKMAQKLDSMCDSLQQLANSEASLTPDQADLLAKCTGLRVNNTTANQVNAIQELIPDDFSVARTQTLLFANTQYVSIMDRLIALRGGARGLSLAGLNVIVDGKLVPLAQLEEMAGKLLGRGASADGADEPGGLLSDKWGLWARGNFSFGEKDQSPGSPKFDADQWAMVGGIDYRVSERAVIGAAASYGSSSVDFAADDGSLDTDSWSVSLYGSAYAGKNFYFDGIVNVANSSYEAERNITYVDGSGLVSADARGDTDGMTLSGGLSAGYDFLVGGLTISPNLGFFYIDTTIDSFTEAGAGGLNLIYDEQKFKSTTGNLGLRLTYAWNLSWGVLLPHLRADYVKEFEDDVDVFGVRFANDPNAASTPPVLVATDNPDQSYWRLAAGFSAQFKYGISGYIEYQRLESFEFINFQDVAIGLRFQRSFGGTAP
ncbi:MAG TPA: autotransporter domain-containing protein [Steroidobacteraceae bacterium]|nr:autotransporter domain-containing protein [Steroidobacteraceae bacterium]